MADEVKKRILWIDVAKAMGMFFIFLGHFGQHAGLAYNWVFSFHVALFFYLSGCLESKNDTDILGLTIHRFIRIMIPYYIIGFIVIVYEAIDKGTISYVKDHFIILMKGGIRNSFYLEVGLWFLTCLFVLETIFTLLRKIIKNKLLILLVCIIIHYLIRATVSSPSWYYNLDSALRFLLYYCIGWISYNFINKLLEDKSRRMIIIKYALFVISVLYSGSIYFGKHYFTYLFGTSMLSNLSESIFVSIFSIYMVVFVSFILKDFKLLQSIGQNSLYLCGFEYIIKNVMATLISIVGLSLIIDNEKQAIIYTIILLIIANYTIVPIFKKLISFIQDDIQKLNKKIAKKVTG